MFDIGWGELVVIGVVALIVIGPKELPTVLRTLGQYMGKVRRMANEFQGQFQEALREAELHDLKKQADDLTSSFTGSVGDFSKFDPMSDAKEAMEHAFDATPNTEPEPAAVPPAEAAPAIEAPPAEPAPAAAIEEAPPLEPPPKSAGGSA